MTDYRLDRLSPRLFEHMIQALAVGAITSTVTPFGDGPDGGREATFEGETSYGSSQALWNGYGVIQAKYHVRPQDTKRDATWAANELRKELKQYTRRKNPRPTPEYFIFVTNVVLSPGINGGKDTISAILRDFANRHDLKAFDIWDYDKLRVLLDRDREVRYSYMAWILPSDVIAELCESLGARKKDYYKIITRYLQRELLADQFAQLEQAGHTADEAIPLAQVFIDLPTTHRPLAMDAPPYPQQEDSTRFVQRIVNESGHSIQAPFSDATVSEMSTAASSRKLSAFGRYVLIGGPGQGKTTIAQYICQIFRCSLLNDVTSDLLDSRVESVIEGLIARWQRDGQSMPAARRLPFRIVLSEFAKSLASGEAESLMGYLAIKLCANSDIKVSAEEIERILSDYPTIIILDGLDEVPASTNRDEVLSAVSNFSIDVATGRLDVFLIATTRPQGYNEEFSPRQYVHQFLAPLTGQDALDYGDRLAMSRFGTNEERFSKVTGRLRRALAKPATARLMRTPLQVTILTLLVDRIGDPPEERWSLFKEYYHLIYERETERDIPSVVVLKEHRVDVDVIHRRVGMALQVESERSGGTDARLTVDQFSHLVEDYLREEGHNGRALDVLKRQIIDAAANRLVFLVGLESGQVGFEIRSLQEFMAAEGIIDGEDVTTRERLRAIASASHWRNVFLFAAGKCFTDRRHMRDTIQAICAELNDDPHDDSLRVLRAGSELALDLLEDGPARKTPFTRETLTRLAIQLLGTGFRGAARIAAICEEETRNIFADYLREQLLTMHVSQSDSAWQCLVILIDRFGGEFERLGREILQTRPMTDGELIVGVESATGQNEWLTKTLFDTFCERGPVLEVQWDDDEDSSEGRRYGPWSRAKFPPWLSWYSRYAAMQWSVRQGSVFRINIGVNAVLHSRFQRISSDIDQWLVPPDNIPQGDPWNAARAIGRFCRSPSASTLAATVRECAESDRPDLWQGLRMFQLPWPLSEVLLAKQMDPSASLDLVIERGRYGNIWDWIEAERKFIEGMPLEEITELEPICNTVDGGFYTFPFRTMRWFSEVRSATGRVPSRLIDLFDSSQNALIRQFIADTAIRLVTSHRPPGEERNSSWIDRVLFFACETASYFNPMFYDVLNSIRLDDGRWSRLFAGYHVRTLDLPLHYSVRERALADLWAVYHTHPEYRGLLVPLAIALINDKSQMRPSITHSVPIVKDDSAIVRTAALVLNITAGASVNELADEIVPITSAEPRIFRTIISAINAREAAYAEECSEIMSLMRMCGLDRFDIWPYLHKNSSRRRSRLLVEGVWRQLGLPDTLHAILDV